MIDDYMKLFRGNDRSYGAWNPKTKKMRTHKKPYNKSVYEKHLKGVMGLGIVPVRDDGRCYFAAIDIDNHEKEEEIDIKTLYTKVTRQKLPLTVCRSKSGGVHLYLFGNEPLEAKLVRGIMGKWSNDLGYPGAEIFPKQEYLRMDEDGKRPLGNWINLPYFNAKSTDRYAWEVKGKADFEFFILNADSRKVTQDILDKLYNENNPDAPPCIQKMIAGGVASGLRNEALYNITVYLKRAFPDSYRDKAFDLNGKIFKEPLPHAEARKTISSAGRRVYKYKCSEDPCKSLCNRELCLERKYGITKKDISAIKQYENMPEFTDLRKYTTDPVTWEIDVDGVTISLMTQNLLDFRRVRQRIADVLTRLIPVMSPKVWTEKLETLMSEAKIIETPDEASTGGIIRAKFLEFLDKADLSSTGKDTKDREALLRGQPVVQAKDKKKVVYFRGQDFVQYLKQTRSEEMKGPNLWFALKKAGVKHTRIRVGKKAIVNVWYVKLSKKGKVEFTKINFEPEF